MDGVEEAGLDEEDEGRGNQSNSLIGQSRR